MWKDFNDSFTVALTLSEMNCRKTTRHKYAAAQPAFLEPCKI